MSGRLPCGHNKDWTIRLVDRGQRYVFCLGCMVEKIGLTTVDGKVPVKMEPIVEKAKKIDKELNEPNKEEASEETKV